MMTGTHFSTRFWTAGLCFVPRALLCLLLLACLSVAGAAQLTVDEVLRLHELGFSETEIQQEVGRSGDPVGLSSADRQRLREAGLSDGFIRFLEDPTQLAPAEKAGRGLGVDTLAPVRTGRKEAPKVEPTPREPPPPAGPSRKLVREVQQALNRLGYSAGPEDGVMGPRTRNAVRAFQRDAGLRETGAIDEQLLAQLKRHREQNRSSPAALAGGWGTVYADAYGNRTEMYLDLFEDGSFASSSVSNMGYADVSGQYRVQGDELTLVNEYGQSETYRFRLQGGQLVVFMPQLGTELTFERY